MQTETTAITWSSQIGNNSTVISHSPTAINKHPTTTRSGLKATITPKSASTSTHLQTTCTRPMAITRNPQMAVHTTVINHGPTGINTHPTTTRRGFMAIVTPKPVNMQSPEDYANQTHGNYSQPWNRHPLEGGQPQPDGNQQTHTHPTTTRTDPTATTRHPRTGVHPTVINHSTTGSNTDSTTARTDPTTTNLNPRIRIDPTAINHSPTAIYTYPTTTRTSPSAIRTKSTAAI